jgi:hypothetical protein
LRGGVCGRGRWYHICGEHHRPGRARVGKTVIWSLIRRGNSLTIGFLSDVDLGRGVIFLGAAPAVGCLAPFKPVNESSTVACLGKLFDAASELLDQFFFVGVVLPGTSFIEVIAEGANVKRNGQEDTTGGTQS